MLRTNGNKTSVSQTTRKCNERTKAKIFEDVDKIIVEFDNLKAKHAALAAANNSVITAEANSNTSGEQLDKPAYTDADSLINTCISAKAYIKSKYGTKGQPYLNIAKTRFVLPSRLRRK